MSDATLDAEALHFAMSHPEAVAREIRKLERQLDEALADAKMNDELWRECEEHGAWQAQERERLREALQAILEVPSHAFDMATVEPIAREALAEHE